MGRKQAPVSAMNVAEKQNTTLAKRLDGLIADVNALKEHLGVSSQAINQYRLGTARPSLENLCKIADFYGVTTDYLLGRTEVKAINENVMTAAKTTGLSEKAVSLLQTFRDDIRRATFDMPELNRLLVSTDFWEMVNRFAVYRHECGVVEHRPKAYAAAKERNDHDAAKRAASELKFARNDKKLSLFEAQQFFFKIADRIESEVKENAVNPKKGE